MHTRQSDGPDDRCGESRPLEVMVGQNQAGLLIWLTQTVDNQGDGGGAIVFRGRRAESSGYGD